MTSRLSGKASLIVAVLVLLPVLYALSLGPVNWLVWRGVIPYWIAEAYARPVYLLPEGTYNFLNAYTMLWGDAPPR